jgi:dienelactone hydrolase
MPLAPRGAVEISSWPRAAWKAFASKRVLSSCALALVAVLALSWDSGSRLVRAGQLLLALSSSPRAPGASGSTAATLIEEDLTIAAEGAPIRARLYHRSDRPRGRGLVISHGVHYKGIDEPRLIPFARELARTGLVVVTPELDDLIDYKITTRGKDVISKTALWLSDRGDLVTDRRVGVLGFSFAGGLGLVAASEPALEDRLSYVTSVGGHHDLDRVLRFLMTNRVETPLGTREMPAHEYGLLVLLYQRLDHFVPEADRGVMREAVRGYLHEDRAEAFAFAARRSTLDSERLFERIAAGKLQELRPELERLVALQKDELRALSPSGRIARLRIPVYLVHGAGDSVIPASETEWAERELQGTEHVALVSPLLEHVEVSKPAGLADQLALVRFMSHLL